MNKRFIQFAEIGLLVLVLMAGSFVAGHETRNVAIGPVFKSSQGLDLASLNDIYATLSSKFDGTIDKTKLLDGAKAGLVAAAGDPYTTYMDAKEAKDLNDDLKGELSGIGAEIAIKNSKLVVVSPIAESPAEKAGLKAGDQILLINDEDTTGMALDQAVSKIRGPKETTVKLKIVRGSTAPFDLTITRALITVASVKWSMKPGNVGYIQISRFGTDTSSKMEQAATELTKQGAKKIVLDLRGNPGGYLDAGVSVASQFMQAGKLVVEERHAGKSTDKLTAEAGGELIGLPTIVLINGGSASASEIVAGALHDSGAARLVGEKSFGKGSVQDITNLGGGAQLKVTIAHWYTPNGVNINKEGIKPDVEVKLEQADYDAGRDPQLDKALELLK